MGRQCVQSKHHCQAPAQVKLEGLWPMGAGAHGGPVQTWGLGGEPLPLPSSCWLTAPPVTRGPGTDCHAVTEDPAAQPAVTLTRAQGHLHRVAGEQTGQPQEAGQALSLSCKQLAWKEGNSPALGSVCWCPWAGPGVAGEQAGEQQGRAAPHSPVAVTSTAARSCAYGSE